MPKKKTHEEFMKDFEERQPELFSKIEILGEYVGTHIKIKYRCMIDGHEDNIRPHDLLQGHGCPECRKAKLSKLYATTHEEFVKNLKKINPNIKIVGEYVNRETKIKCECLLCGHGKNGEDWKPQPASLLAGKGCPKCACRLTSERQTKTHEDFIKELSEINPNIKVLGDYVGTHTGISCECLVCGYGKREDWKPRPGDLLNGHGCPKCACRLLHEKQRKSHEDFIKELSEINPNIKVLGDYVGTHTGISCECLLCGHGKNGDWKPHPHSLLAGKGCPKCAHSSTSWLQEQLFEYFSQKYPSTLYRDKTLIGKELDIVIPELKIAIEPGSWYWHFENENKLPSDYQKQLLCKEKGYTCITLYDKCDFPDVLWYPALIYNENLSKKHENLSQVIQDIEQIIQDHA